jgi:hypothetical protein
MIDDGSAAALGRRITGRTIEAGPVSDDRVA